MPTPSKEKKILELFFNEPTRHWKFGEIRKKIRISDSKLSKWLAKLTKDKIVSRLKKKGKMPVYIGNYDAPEYQNTKRIFGLNMLHEAGLLNHLASLSKAKQVILFGSFNHGDWHKDSDIDIFIFGDDSEFDETEYSRKLHREIQLFSCKNRKEYEQLGEGLIKNIFLGDIIKGDLQFLEVSFNAKPNQDIQ